MTAAPARACSGCQCDHSEPAGCRRITEDHRMNACGSSTIEELRTYVQRINDATNRDDIAAVYEDMTGGDHRLAENNPGATPGELSIIALNYVRELCYSWGVPCATVGLQSDAPLGVYGRIADGWSNE